MASRDGRAICSGAGQLQVLSLELESGLEGGLELVQGLEPELEGKWAGTERAANRAGFGRVEREQGFGPWLDLGPLLVLGLQLAFGPWVELVLEKELEQASLLEQGLTLELVEWWSNRG